MISDPSPVHLNDVELSDDDVRDAMRRIPGYLDITLGDFRELYKLAHDHAVVRVFSHIRACAIMSRGIKPLQPGDMLDQAARSMAEQRLKSMPVVDESNRVVGILTEKDYLRRFGTESFLALLLRLMADPDGLGHRCHETAVRVAMTAPVITVLESADFADIVLAFRQCQGRSVPVVDDTGQLKGLLMRKQFVAACHLGPFGEIES